MKLWAMACRATQDRRVSVESSDKMWSTKCGVQLGFAKWKNVFPSVSFWDSVFVIFSFEVSYINFLLSLFWLKKKHKNSGKIKKYTFVYDIYVDIFTNILLHISFIYPIVNYTWASQLAQQRRTHLQMQEMRVWSPGQEDPLEKEMATTPVLLLGKSHGQPGRLQSMLSQRVRHNLGTEHASKSYILLNKCLHKAEQF